VCGDCLRSPSLENPPEPVHGVHPLDVTFIDDEDLATPWKRENPSAEKLAGPMPKSLTVTLANLIYFEKAELPQALANRLIRLAAFQNPEFYKAQAMRMSVWDKPRVIGCAESYPQHIALPRGCLDAALSLLRDNGIACDLRDERFGGQPLDVSFVGSLRLDQEAAVAGLLTHDAGVLCAPTAFGKTVTAAAMIARRGEVNPLVENYGQVIVDECHHVGAVSFDAILKRTKAKYVLGLTATPVRSDGQQPIIFMQCGLIRHTAATPTGAPHDLAVIPHSRHARIDLPTEAGIQDVFRHIANDPARTAAIAAEVRDAVAQGRKVLVLTERTEQFDAIKTPVSWRGTLQHYAGRLHREHASKTDVRIIDFVDTGHPALLRMWDKRQRGYRAMGYRVEAPREVGEISESCSVTTACP
jgi:superfamily II DNA or RNA helicase